MSADSLGGDIRGSLKVLTERRRLGRIELTAGLVVLGWRPLRLCTGRNRVMVREAEHAAPHTHMSVGPAETPAAARPETVVKPLSCIALPHIPGKSITTALVEFPPQAYHPRTVIPDP
jgi:hypothetical protein